MGVKIESDFRFWWIGEGRGKSSWVGGMAGVGVAGGGAMRTFVNKKRKCVFGTQGGCFGLCRMWETLLEY